MFGQCPPEQTAAAVTGHDQIKVTNLDLVCVKPCELQFPIQGIGKMGFYAKVQIYQVGIVMNEVGLKGAADVPPAAGPSLTRIGFESVSHTQSMKPGGWSQLDTLEGN